MRAMLNSNSKSESSRRPRMIALAFRPPANSTRSPEKIVADTFGNWAMFGRIMASRCSGVKRGCFGLSPMASVTLVEKARGAREDVHVTGRDWIKGSGIDAVAHGSSKEEMA